MPNLTHYTLPLVLAATSCAHVSSQSNSEPDPALTDGDKYAVILENEFVRVLRYHDEPGAKTHLHHHPHFVIYALNAFKRKLTMGDGKSMEREFKAGDVAFMPDQEHVGENIGSTPTEVLLVELK
jgi:beta-alanine degradation protein BauB